MIQLLRDSSLDSTQEGCVDAQETSAEALLSVLSNVLHFSRLEAGGLELDRSDFELLAVVEEACQMVTDQAHAKDLNVFHEVAVHAPRTVTGDRSRLRQILLNLLRNAVKFTAAGEITVRVTTREPNELYFSIADTGIGVSTDRLAAA
ncbi:MAG: ATP-binding protein [Solirubrobacteraceae bacterium]|jgi:signal transduction histidine kinase